MSTRILPLLFALPLLAACEVAEPTVEPSSPPVTEATSPEARPEGIAADEPAPAIAPGAPPAAPPTPVAAAAAGVLAPPPTADVDGEVQVASAEPAVASAAAPAGQLGTTVASLGSPTEGGLWLETPLVDEPTQGRVEYNGQSVAVQLRPSGGEPGSGSQISLEAMRALGAPLTGLPELTVYGG